MSAYLATSPRPARYSRGGNVARVVTSAYTASGWWNAPTRFLPSGRLTAVLPPIAASTCASNVVGACTTADAAVVDGRGEAGGVADHSPAERDDRVVAEQPPRSEARAQVVDGRERLGVFTLADEEEVGGDAGLLEPGSQRGRVEVGDPGLAHHRDPTATGEQRAGFSERAAPTNTS